MSAGDPWQEERRLHADLSTALVEHLAVSQDLWHRWQAGDVAELAGLELRARRQLATIRQLLPRAERVVDLAGARRRHPTAGAK